MLIFRRSNCIEQTDRTREAAGWLKFWCCVAGLWNSASLSGNGYQPPHCRLRDASPLTILLDARRRYGHQRGAGDIVQALVSLQKFSVRIFLFPAQYNVLNGRARGIFCGICSDPHTHNGLFIRCALGIMIWCSGMLHIVVCYRETCCFHLQGRKRIIPKFLQF